MTIRDAEAWGASQADSLQWRHAKSINTWKNKPSKRKERVSLTSSACQAAIQASPVELCGTLGASYHILMGQAPTSHPFTLSQGASPTEQAPAPAAPSSPAPECSP